ncbi:MAG TPA: Xaa-Pro peptidase family protein [Vicinamibacterales bacterium]|nr:Xaa-Pro peptidase family protein [Vicinamibacterales bacterium]
MRFPPTDLLAARHARVRRGLEALGLQALVVTSGTNIRYLSNHAGSAGTLVLTADAVHLLVDFRYEEAVRATQASPAACPALRVWPVPASYDEALVDCLVQLGVGLAGFEAAHLTVARHDWLVRTLTAKGSSIELRSTERLVEQPRVVKDAFELATLRESASRIAAVAQAAFAAVVPGRTEQEVAAVIEAAMRTAGYERIAFDTIVASGPNGALPHHRAGERTLAVGDLVVLDFGGVLHGYCCDLTRTVSVGPPSPDAARVYGAVLEAQQAAIAAVRPGIEASEVDAAARAVLDRRGLGEAFGHGTGHGLGLDVHEEPRVGRRRPDLPSAVLEPGMVFTIEPGAYLSGWGGVRIEDDVLVTQDGGEVLTAVGRELIAL